MKLSDIISGIGVTSHSGSLQKEITSIHTDSRKCTAGSLFIAVKGAENDGHKYIGAAIANGAEAVVCSHFRKSARHPELHSSPWSKTARLQPLLPGIITEIRRQTSNLWVLQVQTARLQLPHCFTTHSQNWAIAADCSQQLPTMWGPKDMKQRTPLRVLLNLTVCSTI